MHCRAVIDTNVLVSAILFEESVPNRLYCRVVEHGHLIVSDELLEELEQVLRRSKFDRYVARDVREAFVRELRRNAELAPTIMRVHACRDPRDNHVLEAALNGEAEFVITGDEDLLALGSFHGMRILAPQDYLDSLER